MAGKLVLSTLNDDTGVLATQNGMTGVAKAWVNFNGAPSTPTIRNSFNVGSITKNSTGDYTVNFTTAMPNATYCPVTQSVGESTTSLRGGSMIVGTWAGGATLKTTTQLRIYTGYTFTTGGAIDSAEVNVAVLSS
jgi:hypothetical protein